MKSAAKRIVEALLNESSSYMYDTGATPATFAKLAALTLEKDKAQLMTQRKVRTASPEEWQAAFKRAVQRPDGVKVIPRHAAPRESENALVTGKFDPKMNYLLTDGDNYLHLGFDDRGNVTYAERFGANDVDELLLHLGDIEDEETLIERGAFDDEDDEGDEDDE